MIRRPPRSTLSSSSAASDVYKRQGLRRICQAYSRIPLSDICVKLALENPSDAEYIVSKAIRDGVVDATIDHENGTVSSSDSVNVYTTTEPLQAFQRRTAFLNVTHEEAKRALRYVDPDADPELEEENKKKKLEDMKKLQQALEDEADADLDLSLIHISEPTRLLSISYAVFCLKKKKIKVKKNQSKILKSDDNTREQIS
eukprot:TRINITY_DN21229_c0_g1_i2.p1 TRINITY_DN21229_c0_g1~~TRINITY_DN21229_c0_g1_i2.p1  ORF type:complete len:200 (+),score=75.14 TRINITY_DN21229_c0_g1_i2:83-682(+)